MPRDVERDAGAVVPGRLALGVAQQHPHREPTAPAAATAMASACHGRSQISSSAITTTCGTAMTEQASLRRAFRPERHGQGVARPSGGRLPAP